MKESLNFITAALQNRNEQREKDNVMINGQNLCFGSTSKKER